MDEKFNNATNSNGSAQGGKKTGYVWKILLMIILSVLVLSPLDALPDVMPVVGWVDDVAYVAGIIGTAVSMLKGKRAQQLTGASEAHGYIPPVYNEVKSNRKK